MPKDASTPSTPPPSLPGECPARFHTLDARIDTSGEQVHIYCGQCRQVVYVLSPEAERELGAVQILKLLLKHAHNWG